VSFAVAADLYDRFMGRYSVPLSAPFADFAGVSTGQRVLDVGCGPGALTAELARRLGSSAVSAVDPSESFVEAMESRHPGVDVQRAPAEQLPFGDDDFDATLAQLVVHFLPDPIAGVREMARVTRAGGIVAACVWDHAGSDGPLSPFWEAAHDLDPEVADESELPGAREGHLAELFEAAGLREVEGGDVAVTVRHPTFDDWWEPYTLGVGPAGAYVAGLDPGRREELRERCRERLAATPIVLTARAWATRGRP
jgi:SAM-dependent methyltransferase